MEEGILQLYKSQPDLEILFELMTDFDEGFQEWRYRHIKLVERSIGSKKGTGGSLGVEFLKKSLFHAAFSRPVGHPAQAMIYDITPPISDRLQVWPGDTPPSREVLCDMKRGANFTLSTLRATVHLGAHADAPSHYGRRRPSHPRAQPGLLPGPVPGHQRGACREAPA